MNPEFVKIGDEKYPINTDFKIALECDKIARDKTIGEYEKIITIIYKLFGEKGLNDKHNWEKLAELGQKYLICNQEETSDDKEINMDFEQDKGRIKASFFSDYKVENVYDRYMHWWDFSDYLNGLTENCALNFARYVRDKDISDIKDAKERKYWGDLKKAYALKKKEKTINENQKESVNRFMELAKLK